MMIQCHKHSGITLKTVWGPKLCSVANSEHAAGCSIPTHTASIPSRTSVARGSVLAGSNKWAQKPTDQKSATRRAIQCKEASHTSTK